MVLDFGGGLFDKENEYTDDGSLKTGTTPIFLSSGRVNLSAFTLSSNLAVGATYEYTTLEVVGAGTLVLMSMYLYNAWGWDFEVYVDGETTASLVISRDDYSNYAWGSAIDGTNDNYSIGNFTGTCRNAATSFTHWVCPNLKYNKGLKFKVKNRAGTGNQKGTLQIGVITGG